jgi:fucose 4-O-acetylase-like acetyltransferase
MSEPSKRVLWLDIARAIGISLVVYGHVLGGLANAGRINHSGLLFNSGYCIYTFHMPLFFLLAGINVDHSLLKGKRKFLEGKLWLIAYPYFLWSLLQGGIQIAFARYINTPPTVHILLQIPWKPLEQFWFLQALFICHLLAMIVSSRLRILVPVAVATYLHDTLYPNSFHLSAEYMLPFYVLGIFLGRYGSGATIRARLLGPACAVAAVAYALSAFWGKSASGGDVHGLASLPACLAGIFLVIAVSQLIERLSARFAITLAGVGVASMTIYVMHVLTGSGTRVVLGRLGIGNVAAHLVLGTAAGVLVPYVAHKLLKEYNLLWPLGLGPLPHKRLKALA